MTISAGAPQGSLLGRLLFLVYINQIVTKVASDIYLFADDTIIMRVVTDPIQELNTDFEHLSQWAKEWSVKFSAAKSEQLLVSRKQVRTNYNSLLLNGVEIKRVPKHSHLGLVFTETFSWEAHISSRIKKAGPALNMLIRQSYNMPRVVKKRKYTNHSSDQYWNMVV